MAGRDVNININGKDNFSQAANSASRSAVSLKGTLGALNSISIGGVGSIGGLMSAAGLGAMAAGSIKLAAGYEQTNVAFKTMLKSGSMATDLLGKLSKFAQETPFQFTELTDASKKLLAFGVASGEVIPTLRRLGDIASGIGIPLGELSEIYGKARVQGRLFAEDVNQLTGRGIPVIQEFAKQFGVTENEVRKLVETGQVGFKNLEQALIDMTSGGGQFTGMMVEQSKTLLGQWSSLKDTMEQIGRTMGEKLLPGFQRMAGAANWMLGNGMSGVPAMANPIMPTDPNVVNAIQVGNAIDEAKAELKTGVSPARRKLLEAKIKSFQAHRDELQGRIQAKNQADAAKKQAAADAMPIGGPFSDAGFGSAFGDSVRGAMKSISGGTGLLDTVKGARAKIDLKNALFAETRTPQEKFDAAMAELRGQRGEIGDDLFNRKRRMLEDDLAATFDKNSPQSKEQRQRGLAPLTEARFLTSAPGYAADPATRAAQETANTSKEQLVVLRAMERKLQRQTRLGVL